MKILVTGASGLVGSALVPALRSDGHEVSTLSIPRPGRGQKYSDVWPDLKARIAPDALSGWDAVVHLAGESINGRWTPAKKERINSSRTLGTALISERIAQASPRPRILINASAIGYYGFCTQEPVTESSPTGSGFLAEVTRNWEAATKPASDAGVRVVMLRFGVILSPKGGALKMMLPPFRACVGGIAGDGNQNVSWVAIDDVVGVVRYTLSEESIFGAVNVVAPVPVTNRELTRTLARVLNRPAIFPMPAFLLRTLLSNMVEETVLASQHVVPEKLIRAGFHFQHPELEGALRSMPGVPA